VCGRPLTSACVLGRCHSFRHSGRWCRWQQARPIYHQMRDSIEAHLTIVFAALAVSRWIEDRSDWSIKKNVRTVRRYRTVEIQAGDHVIIAADPCPATFTKPSAASTAIPLRTNSAKSAATIGQ
jgi:hypothetical protein